MARLDHACGQAAACGSSAWTYWAGYAPPPITAQNEPGPTTSTNPDHNDGPSATPQIVLVVDDDVVVRQVLARHLKIRGYHVHTAADGQQALAIFADQGADLVLLDVRMPGIDGFEVCTAIRSKADVPVIFMTGAQEPIIRNHMNRLTDAVGGCAYLTKPLDSRRLLDLVGDVLRN